MLTLNDGRKELYQWDIGRKASVSVDCDEVHFAHLNYADSLPVKVVDGEVEIPNQLLTVAMPLLCWAFVEDADGHYTKQTQTIEVLRRAKPADYLYTPTEVISVKDAVNQGLEEAKASGEFDGEKGDKGDKGDPLTFEDLTPEQIDELTGEVAKKAIADARESANDASNAAEAASRFASESFGYSDDAARYANAAADLVERAAESADLSSNAAYAASGYAEQAQESAEEAKRQAESISKSLCQVVASAIKETARGEVVGLTDVSPIEHEMGVKVRSKNLIPVPYKTVDGEYIVGQSYVKNGVTFIINADGSITLNGTAGANIFFSLVTPHMKLSDGAYTLSGGYRGTDGTSRVAVCVRDETDTIMASCIDQSATFTTAIKGNLVKEAYLYVYKGAVLDNVTVYPQLEAGATATAYTPHIEDISTVKVKKYGKNLLNRNATEVTRGTLTFDGSRQTFTSVGGGGDLDTIIGRYKDFVGKTITVSYTFVDFKGSYSVFNTFIQADSNALVYSSTYDKTTKLFKMTYTIPENDSAEFLIIRQYVGYMTSVDGDYVTIDKLQVEIGDAVTEWEEYKELVEYPVSADGTVEGVTSLSPVTTLMTDTAGAVIDATYNADTKKYIDKKFAELQNVVDTLLGG